MSSEPNKDLSADLSDVSYEIKDELQMRKVLEQHTDWMFEFNKHEQYDYDMRIKQWDDKPQTNDDNTVLGFVELERSRKDKEHSWVTGDIPESWNYPSFLMRKVREYDHHQGSWKGLKDNYERTVYLKFNHAQDNCFAAPIEAIHRDGIETKFSDGSYNNSYLKLRFSHSDVHIGIRNCIEFIEEYLEERSDCDQRRLTRWGGGDD
jgi:hypothetical protein